MRLLALLVAVVEQPELLLQLLRLRLSRVPVPQNLDVLLHPVADPDGPGLGVRDHLGEGRGHAQGLVLRDVLPGPVAVLQDALEDSNVVVRGPARLVQVPAPTEGGPLRGPLDDPIFFLLVLSLAPFFFLLLRDFFLLLLLFLRGHRLLFLLFFLRLLPPLDTSCGPFGCCPSTGDSVGVLFFSYSA